MARIEGEIIIDRPVDVVFDYVADQRNEPRYNPQMVRAERSMGIRQEQRIWASLKKHLEAAPTEPSRS
jgi:hypothetical protein